MLIEVPPTKGTLHAIIYSSKLFTIVNNYTVNNVVTLVVTEAFTQLATRRPAVGDFAGVETLHDPESKLLFSSTQDKWKHPFTRS